MEATYDRIGAGYSQVRPPDQRLAILIAKGLGDARTVVNIGADAGSYEPAGRHAAAVEHSAVMLGQHPGANRIQASAESLPFADRSLDAAMAIMTVHHWADLPSACGNSSRCPQAGGVHLGPGP